MYLFIYLFVYLFDMYVYIYIYILHQRACNHAWCILTPHMCFVSICMYRYWFVCVHVSLCVCVYRLPCGIKWHWMQPELVDDTWAVHCAAPGSRRVPHAQLVEFLQAASKNSCGDCYLLHLVGSYPPPSFKGSFGQVPKRISADICTSYSMLKVASRLHGQPLDSGPARSSTTYELGERRKSRVQPSSAQKRTSRAELAALPHLALI